jgi:thiol-disulfide isomerase/thioredoxin
MKRMQILQIIIIFAFIFSFFNILFTTDVYDEVQRKIVEELCLSCIKLKPNTIKEYRFETANGVPNPKFILENLSKGPVILDYRITFCPGCEDLENNILSKVFNTSFPNPLQDNQETEIPDLLYLEREFKNTNVTFIHFNTDDENSLDVPPDGIYAKSRDVYDVVGDQGNPMVVFITYGYNHGFIEPFYCTLYDIESEKEVLDLIFESVDLFNEHKQAH